MDALEDMGEIFENLDISENMGEFFWNLWVLQKIYGCIDSTHIFRTYQCPHKKRKTVRFSEIYGCSRRIMGAGIWVRLHEMRKIQ